MDEDTAASLRYLERAEEIRVIADCSSNEQVRVALLGISANYVKMAETRRLMGLHRGGLNAGRTSHND